MAQPIRLLLVEDNPSDVELVALALRRDGFEATIEQVDTEADYVAALSRTFDVILSDFELPQFDGLRALDLRGERGVTTPFIIVSGTIGEATAVEAMKRGAADYLLKDRLGRLGAAIRHVSCFARWWKTFTKSSGPRTWPTRTCSMSVRASRASGGARARPCSPTPGCG
jgi:DNA-binding NtrC family response regulator